MLQSHIIEVDGAFVGVAVRIDRGYRFVATDCRLEELDTSIWPTLDDVRRLARRSLLAATSAGPVSPALHAVAHLASVKRARSVPQPSHARNQHWRSR